MVVIIIPKWFHGYYDIKANTKKAGGGIIKNAMLQFLALPAVLFLFYALSDQGFLYG